MDIVQGARKILEIYDHRVPNPPPFKVIASSASDLLGPVVLHALLDHAPRQSKVALNIWKEISPCLQGLVSCTGNPERFDTLKLILASTSIRINGFIHKLFEVRGGVRQGDPMSCLLYNLAIEPLIEMIRRSPLRGLHK
jgi:hypothetical protein